MGMEYGVRIKNGAIAPDRKQEQVIMDKLYSRLAIVLNHDPDYRIKYDQGKLAILQDDEKWPDVMNTYIDEASGGELAGIIGGERYLYIISYTGSALAVRWFAAIDEVMSELVPGSVREEL
ncbi:hypothetical protein [Paenibacillus wenxiniae]|uniref:Uncharacterized protein n=1 Tax=Paenibacillus wenxiniae TaxID=1636843 RepID=A0ABW4RSA9_9BACL